MDAILARSETSAGRRKAAGILYVSYDGMLEPLGQSQVLAYLERLAPGRRIHLMSFEKRQDWSDRTLRDSIGRRIAAAGIRWHPLRYHKSPSGPATAFDIAAGSAAAVALVLRHHLRVVHARSYVAGLMGLAAKRATGASLLFDMRGFWADERVEGGLWKSESPLYRAAKSIERKLLLSADHIVTLTHASEAELRRRPDMQGRLPPVSVIPTCADLDRFTAGGPPQREPFVLGYAGSVGTWYLLDEMLRCFLAVRDERPGARLLIVNRREQDLIRERANAHGIAPGEIEIAAGTHLEMPAFISRMTAAVALYKTGYSRIACAPTKLAEYLGCGVPCLGTAGVGDLERILEPRRVGVTIGSFDEREIASAVRRLIALAEDELTPGRCRAAAVELFSLDRAAADYSGIYQRLVQAALECA